MPAIYRHSLSVPATAIDAQGHVGNVEYLRWMQDAAVAHSAAQGWDARQYEELEAGWVVRSHRIEYLQPAFENDHLTVVTWVAGFRKIRSLRKYRIVRETDETVLAKAETDWAFIGLEHRVPRLIPPELIESFDVVTDEP